MKINEIFYSIQGESSFMGLPCVFVRLSTCNLRCSYCDTAYAFFEGREMAIADVLSAVSAYPARLALVTGGEPLLQPDVHILIKDLLDSRFTVCLETGGHLPLQDVDPRVHKIMDLKCPSSGMVRHNNYDNVQYLTKGDEIKFVVGDREDFDWACDATTRYDLAARAGVVLFSPVYGVLPYADLARWVLDCGLPVRLQLQLHKVIWPEIKRGA